MRVRGRRAEGRRCCLLTRSLALTRARSRSAGRWVARSLPRRGRQLREALKAVSKGAHRGRRAAARCSLLGAQCVGGTVKGIGRDSHCAAPRRCCVFQVLCAEGGWLGGAGGPAPAGCSAKPLNGAVPKPKMRHKLCVYASTSPGAGCAREEKTKPAGGGRLGGGELTLRRSHTPPTRRRQQTAAAGGRAAAF